MNSFQRHMIDLIESIEDCLAKQRILPFLALLYTGIDVIASLETNGRASRASFETWVNRFLLKAGPFNCSATDLYAARCGVLHTFTPGSDLARSGEAFQISYAYGNANLGTFDKVSQIIAWKGGPAVHVRDFTDAFRNAIANYMQEIQADPVRLHRVEMAAGLWFAKIDSKSMDDFLVTHESQSGSK